MQGFGGGTLIINIIKVIRSFRRKAHYNITKQDKTIRYARTAGKKVFHVKFIKRSYRIRGKVPRIQINAKATNSVFRAKKRPLRIGILWEEENSATVNILIAKILVYSAIKINANGPDLYSVLKPDTSSDSPSA